MSSSSETNSYESILEIVRQWTPAQRFHLVQEVLKTLEPKGEPVPKKRQALRELYGLLATDQPPPSDEDVRRWLDERRWEKYGK